MEDQLFTALEAEQEEQINHLEDLVETLEETNESLTSEVKDLRDQLEERSDLVCLADNNYEVWFRITFGEQARPELSPDIREAYIAGFARGRAHPGTDSP